MTESAPETPASGIPVLKPNSPELRKLIKDRTVTRDTKSLNEVPQLEGRPTQYLEQKQPIIKHPSRTGTRVEGNPKLTSLRGEGAKLREPYSIDVKTGAVTFPRLPACPQPEVRRVEVFSYSPLSDMLDMVFYDGHDKAEIYRAEKLIPSKIVGRGVRFLGGVELQPDQVDDWNRYAMTQGIYCLPTRTRLITEAGRRFMEFRTGSEAWIETKQDFENQELAKQIPR